MSTYYQTLFGRECEHICNTVKITSLMGKAAVEDRRRQAARARVDPLGDGREVERERHRVQALHGLKDKEERQDPRRHHERHEELRRDLEKDAEADRSPKA